ncbi:MAG: thiamine phosphate synthase [Candidatus Binatia bacterium]
MRALPSPSVQLITGAWTDLADLEARVSAALRGGIRWLQLRSPGRPARELHDAALHLAPLLHEAGALFVMNDRVDVALAARADGVHLPEAGMSPSDARRLLGPDAWVARSVHSLAAIEATAPHTVDAFQFGPVFDTASKREFGAPQGLEALACAAEAARAGATPVIAVGGVTRRNETDCRRCGARAVAVIGAIWNAGDIEAAAREWTGG